MRKIRHFFSGMPAVLPGSLYTPMQKPLGNFQVIDAGFFFKRLSCKAAIPANQ